MSAILLRVTGVGKAYAAPVLKHIDLSIAPGEVVALTGENGAGKSTLSKIIAGLVPPDSGEMELNGVSFRPGNRSHAERAGVRMVLQELGLVPTLSVAENLQLGAIPSRAGFVRFAELERVALKQLELLGLTELDPSRPAGDLGIGQQQLVEIARSLASELRLLILDEPTAMLTAPEVARLFEQIAVLQRRGVGVLYISHRLDEIHRITDRVVVLRDGELVADRATQGFAHDDIVSAMIGRKFAQRDGSSRRTTRGEMLRLAGMTSGRSVRNVNLSVQAGEIVGLAGLVGAGRTELLRLVFGADPRDAGDIFLGAAPNAARIESPIDAVAQGIGLLTEDRKSQGLLLGQPIAMNLTLADLPLISRRGCIQNALECSAWERWRDRLQIRARDGLQFVDELSGGNQQKVLLARWLHRDCRVLLLDEPTRGIDVGARADIYEELDRLAAAGKAIVMVSSDLRELMSVCDRIAVMSAGVLVKVFERGDWDEQTLLNAAFAEHGMSQVMNVRSA